jgi:hypothetical protein
MVTTTRVTTTRVLPFRLCARVAALGLFGWAGLAFLHGSTIVFRPDDGGTAPLTVQCAALVGLFGDQWRFYGHGEDTSLLRFHVSSLADVGLPMPGQQIEAECDRERLASAGLIGVLSGPAAILAVMGVRPRRRYSQASPVPGLGVEDEGW